MRATNKNKAIWTRSHLSHSPTLGFVLAFSLYRERNTNNFINVYTLSFLCAAKPATLTFLIPPVSSLWTWNNWPLKEANTLEMASYVWCGLMCTIWQPAQIHCWCWMNLPSLTPSSNLNRATRKFPLGAKFLFSLLRQSATNLKHFSRQIQKKLQIHIASWIVSVTHSGSIHHAQAFASDRQGSNHGSSDY